MYNNIGKVTLERAAVQTAVTVKMGIDQHAADVVVSVQEDGLPAKRARRMGAEQLIELVQKYVNAAAKVYTAYEAGPCGYWLHRRLEAAGAKNVVVVPQRWDRENRNVKTDKRDALELCNRLDSYLRGNTKAFSLVCVPTPEQEQRRAIGRQRGWLGKERRRCIARAFGVPVIGLFACTDRERCGPYSDLRWSVNHYDEASRRFMHRPASELPTPINSLSASAACMAPTTPTSGANTPMVEQATSSNC